MSGASRIEQTRRPRRHTYISSADVLEYCLRCVVVDHILRNRSKFSAPSAQAIPDNTSSRTLFAYKNAGIPSVAEILGSGAAKKNNKFPSGLIKLLSIALQRVVMRQEPDYDDPHVRSTFGVFYNYYISDVFQKSIKDNRKVEDLILMFFSKATGELQKRLPEDEVKKLVNIHVAKFVRLILLITRTNKLASSDSDFVNRLSGYESKLLQHSTLMDSDPPLFGVSGQAADTQPPKLSQVPSARALQSIFRTGDNAMQAMLCSIYKELALEIVLRDLKLQLHYVSSQSGNSYRTSDFESEENYTSWKQQEIKHLTKTILKITTMNPLSTVVRSGDGAAVKQHENSTRSRSLSYASEVADVTTRTSEVRVDDELISAATSTSELSILFLVPQERFAMYHEFLSTCLEIEFSRIDSALGESHDHSQTVILSRDCLDLLKLCRNWWRITDACHVITYLDICTSRFIDDRLSIELLDEVLADVRTDMEKYTAQLTVNNKEQYTKVMMKLNESLFRDLYAELQLVYTRQLDTRIIAVIEEYLQSDNILNKSTTEFANLFDQMELGLRQAASEAYRELRNKVIQGKSLEILLIVKLAETLGKELQKLKNRFRRPILDVIDVWDVYLQTCIPEFLGEVPSFMAQCYQIAQAQQVEFAMEDMFDLYRAIIKIHKYGDQYLQAYRSPVQLDQYFRPTILQWLSRAHSSIQDLVSRSLIVDTFLLDPVASDDSAICSGSIISLFRSFNQHLKFLRDLQWPEEYWSAKFFTNLSQIFSEAIKEYCEQLEKLFTAELSYQTDQIEADESALMSLQQRIIARARETIAKKEIIAPFHISATACVKLNNVEWAKERLDSLERNVDSPTLSATIEKYEGVQPIWIPGRRCVFSIKVVAAENLVPCDSNGFSDPYVVITDHKGKRVGRTRTIYTSLNPRWDETFEVPATEALWLAATVWDRDSGGEHDICGRCHFKLDPRFFMNCLPKDFYLNLDTQGILHFNIRMEPELDDSSFYLGRAFRFLEKAESNMTQSIVEKMTPYISTSLTRATLQALFLKPFTLDKTLDSALSLLNKAGFSNSKTSTPGSTSLSNTEMEAAIEDLMQYLDNNFKVLDQSLTRSAFELVMMKLWRYVLVCLEDIVIPPLFGGPLKNFRPLPENGLDVVYKWLGFLKDTFSGDGGGLSEEELQTPLYHELLSVRFFYFDSVEELIRECDRIGSGNLSIKSREAPQVLSARSYSLGTIKRSKHSDHSIRKSLGTSEEIIVRVSIPILACLRAYMLGLTIAQQCTS